MERVKQFIIPIIIGLLIAGGVYYTAPKIYENYQGYLNLQQEIETKNATIRDKQQKLDEYKRKEEEEKRREEESAKNQKPFYKPVMEGLDTEAVISGEFAEILQLVRANQIKVRGIKYEYDPKDDAFVQGAGDRYNVARLNMEMVGTYSNYDNLLKELYKHDHFLDIQSVEIVPYKKNKKILLINFKLKLYSKK